MIAFLVSFLVTPGATESAADRVAAAMAYGRARRSVSARCDVSRALVNGRAQSWRERLNRDAFAARSRVVFLAPDLEHVRTLRERAIRCDVFAERAGYVGRASFTCS